MTVLGMLALGVLTIVLYRLVCPRARCTSCGCRLERPRIALPDGWTPALYCQRCILNHLTGVRVYCEVEGPAGVDHTDEGAWILGAVVDWPALLGREFKNFGGEDAHGGTRLTLELPCGVVAVTCGTCGGRMRRSPASRYA